MVSHDQGVDPTGTRNSGWDTICKLIASNFDGLWDEKLDDQRGKLGLQVEALEDRVLLATIASLDFQDSGSSYNGQYDSEAYEPYASDEEDLYDSEYSDEYSGLDQQEQIDQYFDDEYTSHPDESEPEATGANSSTDNYNDQVTDAGGSATNSDTDVLFGPFLPEQPDVPIGPELDLNEVDAMEDVALGEMAVVPDGYEFVFPELTADMFPSDQGGVWDFEILSSLGILGLNPTSGGSTGGGSANGSPLGGGGSSSGFGDSGAGLGSDLTQPSLPEVSSVAVGFYDVTTTDEVNGETRIINRFRDGVVYDDSETTVDDDETRTERTWGSVAIVERTEEFITTSGSRINVVSDTIFIHIESLIVIAEHSSSHKYEWSVTNIHHEKYAEGDLIDEITTTHIRSGWLETSRSEYTFNFGPFKSGSEHQAVAFGIETSVDESRLTRDVIDGVATSHNYHKTNTSVESLAVSNGKSHWEFTLGDVSGDQETESGRKQGISAGNKQSLESRLRYSSKLVREIDSWIIGGEASGTDNSRSRSIARGFKKYTNRSDQEVLGDPSLLGYAPEGTQESLEETEVLEGTGEGQEFEDDAEFSPPAGDLPGVSPVDETVSQGDNRDRYFRFKQNDTHEKTTNLLFVHSRKAEKTWGESYTSTIKYGHLKLLEHNGKTQHTEEYSLESGDISSNDYSITTAGSESSAYDTDGQYELIVGNRTETDGQLSGEATLRSGTYGCSGGGSGAHTESKVSKTGDDDKTVATARVGKSATLSAARYTHRNLKATINYATDDVDHESWGGSGSHTESKVTATHASGLASGVFPDETGDENTSSAESNIPESQIAASESPGLIAYRSSSTNIQTLRSITSYDHTWRDTRDLDDNENITGYYETRDDSGITLIFRETNSHDNRMLARVAVSHEDDTDSPDPSSTNIDSYAPKSAETETLTIGSKGKIIHRQLARLGSFATSRTDFNGSAGSTTRQTAGYTLGLGADTHVELEKRLMIESGDLDGDNGLSYENITNVESTARVGLTLGVGRITIVNTPGEGDTSAPKRATRLVFSASGEGSDTGSITITDILNAKATRSSEEAGNQIEPETREDSLTLTSTLTFHEQANFSMSGWFDPANLLASLASLTSDGSNSSNYTINIVGTINGETETVIDQTFSDDEPASNTEGTEVNESGSGSGSGSASGTIISGGNDGQDPYNTQQVTNNGAPSSGESLNESILRQSLVRLYGEFFGTDDQLLEAFLHPEGGNGNIVIGNFLSTTSSYTSGGWSWIPKIYIDESELEANGLVWGALTLHQHLNEAYIYDKRGSESTQSKHQEITLGEEGAGGLSVEMAEERAKTFKAAAGDVAEILETIGTTAEITFCVVNDGADVAIMIRDVSDPSIGPVVKGTIIIAGGLPFIPASAGRKVGEGLVWVWQKTGGRLFKRSSIRGATTYGKNALGHFRTHSQHIRETARKLGIDIPNSPRKLATQAAMKEFIEKVVKEGAAKTGKFKDVVDAQWYKLGDAIVVRRPNGEWLSFLDYSKKSPLSNLWDSM